MQRDIANITYEDKDNFYYYAKPNTNPSDFQFGYFTIHGKLIGSKRLMLPNDFDYLKTSNWLTSCGIDWDKNEIITDTPNSVFLEDNFDPRLPADFPYDDVYDYLAISLNEKEYKQLLPFWSSKYFLSFKDFNQLLQSRPELKFFEQRINDSLALYGKNKIRLSDLNRFDKNIQVSKPFQIRPGFRAQSSSVNVFGNKQDILYVMTGDALFQPHFYGTGGFRRGAELSLSLATMIKGKYFGEGKQRH